MLCPRCKLIERPKLGFRESARAREEGVPLEAKKHASGEEYLACPSCGGAFVERTVMRAIERWARDRGRRASADEVARRAFQAEQPVPSCPRCEVEMFTRQWGIGTLVRVDVCIDCNGVWLDAGELEQLETPTF